MCPEPSRHPGGLNKRTFERRMVHCSCCCASRAARGHRCTKNWILAYDHARRLWSRLPWDLEGALGISSSLGGLPASDYCVLACEQWNSPLYCDSDHPQARLP